MADWSVILFSFDKGQVIFFIATFKELHVLQELGREEQMISTDE